MDTAVDRTGKLLCPNLVTMLTKTIRAMCEVNVTYDQRLEITGCLHIRSDGHQVVACLIDEHFDRPEADELPCHSRRSEDVTYQERGTTPTIESQHVNNYRTYSRPEDNNVTDNVDEDADLASGDDASDCSKSSLEGSTVHTGPQYGIMHTNALYSQRKGSTKLADFADFVQMDCGSSAEYATNHANANSENSENVVKQEWSVTAPPCVKNEPVESWQQLPPVRTTSQTNPSGTPTTPNYDTMSMMTTPLCSEVVDNNNGGTKKKKFQCMLCGIYLSAKCYLKNHINAVHTKARVYPCEVCKKLFYSAGAVRIHKLRNHWHGAKKHRCRHCGELFLLPVELRKHIYKAHGEVPLDNSLVSLQDGQPTDELPAPPDELTSPDMSFSPLVASGGMAASQAVFP